MSWITFDYKCPGCGYTEERFVRKSEMDVQQCDQCCHQDGHIYMTRLPAGPKTTFRFADGPKKDTKKASNPSGVTLKLEK